jgi:hypothetical protein
MSRKKKQDIPSSRFIQPKPVPIKSFPRTLLKLGVTGIILHQLLSNTPFGKDLIIRSSQQITNMKKKAAIVQSEFDPKTRGQKRQDAVDERFDDAWKRAGGESEN